MLLCAVGYSELFTLWWVMIGLGLFAAVMFPPAILLTSQLSDPGTRGSAMGGFNLAGSLGFARGAAARRRRLRGARVWRGLRAVRPDRDRRGDRRLARRATLATSLITAAV